MLTNADCKNFTCPDGKPHARITDAAGLYLEVSPAGSKRWFCKLYVDGKEKRLSLGSYPAVTLKAARAARDEARKVKAAGIDPVQQRLLDKAAVKAGNAMSFEAVARAFHEVRADGWSPSHADKWMRSMENHLFPLIGTLPIASITSAALLAALRVAEAKGFRSTAADLKTQAGQVFRYGIGEGACERDLSTDLRGSLRTHTAKNFSAVLKPAQVGGLMRAIDGYTGQPATRTALQLSALLFQRPGNICAMEWAEIDTDGAMWVIPAMKMKRRIEGKLNGPPHVVPLAVQAVALLEALRPLTGHGRYVFPGARSHDRPMSNNTVNAALRRLDFGSDDHVAHGFRAMARTLIGERLPGIGQDVIEAQLAHGKSGPLGSAYDRADYMEQRKLMMQTWADYLDTLRAGAQIIPIKAA